MISSSVLRIFESFFHAFEFRSCCQVLSLVGRVVGRRFLVDRFVGFLEDDFRLFHRPAFPIYQTWDGDG